MDSFLYGRFFAAGPVSFSCLTYANDEKNRRVFSELKAIGVPSVAMKVDVTIAPDWRRR
jgi:hypothetical protein